jgi:hypothetical protein
VDLVAAVVTDEQSLELVEPGEGALDDPAGAAEAGAVLGVAARDLRGDPALAPSGTPRRLPYYMSSPSRASATTSRRGDLGAWQPHRRPHHEAVPEPLLARHEDVRRA